MQDAALTTVALTGFTVAFFHAVIPTHWLPFVLVARARGWSRAKTLAVTAAAGSGHVAITSLLGLIIAWFGFRIDATVGAEKFPWIVGGLLEIFALFYFWRQWTGRGILHHHPPGSGHHADEHCGHGEQSHWQEEMKDTQLVSRKSGDWAAISGLLVMLTLSPCEGFLPIYLSGVQFGWRGFFVLSGILALATFAGMTLFTWLALLGFERIRIKNFERYESGLLGALFAVLGVVVVILEHGEH